MTRIERIFTDWISANLPDPRHPRSILSFIWARPERLHLPIRSPRSEIADAGVG